MFKIKYVGLNMKFKSLRDNMICIKITIMYYIQYQQEHFIVPRL